MAARTARTRAPDPAQPVPLWAGACGGRPRCAGCVRYAIAAPSSAAPVRERRSHPWKCLKSSTRAAGKVLGPVRLLEPPGPLVAAFSMRGPYLPVGELRRTRATAHSVKPSRLAILSISSCRLFARMSAERAV